MQVNRNNDPLFLNLVNKYVLSDLLKLEMVLDFRIYMNSEYSVSIGLGIRSRLH